MMIFMLVTNVYNLQFTIISRLNVTLLLNIPHRKKHLILKINEKNR